MERFIDFAANIAAIVTGVVAVVASVAYFGRALQRRHRLESYLKGEKESDKKWGDAGLRSPVHLVANLRMSEAQIFEVAFASRRIRMKVTRDDKGRATGIMFVYEPS